MSQTLVTAMDAPAGQLDADEQKFVAIIREHGFHIMHVGDGGGGAAEFSYTTGFWLNLGHPELIAFNMDKTTAGTVFWDIWARIVAGDPPPVETRTDRLFVNVDGYLRPVGVEHFGEHLGWARWFYGGDVFPCLQLIWPDPENRFPWEAGFDAAFDGLQPDLSPVKTA